MKNSWKTSLALAVVAILSLGLMAFSPLDGDSDSDGVSDYTEALAEALGVSVDDLQAAQQSAKEAAIAQAVTDGTLTQEQADAMLAGETTGKAGRHFRGSDYDTYLADALGITLEELQTAQQTVRDTVVSEKGTRDDDGLGDARSSLSPYLEDAYQQAYQEAVDAALADGAITNEEAAQLLENIPSIGHGFGSHGGRP